jgi:hypothetical protein
MQLLPSKTLHQKVQGLIRKCLLLSIAIPAILFAQTVPAGGKGNIESGPWCFETGSSTISKICGSSTLHYEYASLMGEPTLHYGMRWTLTSLTVHTGAKDAPATGHEIYVNFPEFNAIFNGAEKRIEIMAHGLAGLRSNADDRTWGIEFDTGAPTVANKMSWHVADVKNWDSLVFYSTDCYALDRKKQTYLSKENARNIWKSGGIRLVKFAACKDGNLGLSVSNLSAAETAVSRYCKAHPGKDSTLQCPTKELEKPAQNDSPLDTQSSKGQKTVSKTKPQPGEMLDEVADAPKIASGHSKMMKDFKLNAQASCARAMEAVDRCIKQSPACKPKPENEVKTCVANQCGKMPEEKICARWEKIDPCRGVKASKGENVLCLGPSHRCAEYETNPEHTKWASCSAAAHRCRYDSACLSACNSGGALSAGECMDKTMQNAPTVNDARKEYDAKTNQRTKQSSGTHNFLD